MNHDRFAQFAGQKYLSLESFRKNGQGVRTPVWFAEENGIFYFYSEAESFKVKRIRNNPTVRIAPCDVRGNVKGEWVEGTARVLEGDDSRRVHELLNRKYHLLKWIANLTAKVRRHRRAEVAIRLN
ncbi:MAG: PPOX class F420-dependent oxidoreductase [Blastocatellia bacterium]|nr:PPOX class F420-dependent oxidoreductase [Blastocatellia bacterium]